MSDAFLVKNGLKQDVLSQLLLNFNLEYTLRNVQENKKTVIKWDKAHSIFPYSPH
jgi:hypothetical protein